MPIYRYRCAKCNQEFEKVAKIADRNNQVHDCGGCGELIFSRPFVFNEGRVGNQSCPYFDIALGKKIESRSHRLKILKQEGKEEAG